MFNDVAVFANIVGIIVVLFVAISFIVLAIFFFKSQKKLIENRLEDDEISSEIYVSISKVKDKFRSRTEINDYFVDKKKVGRIWSNVLTYSFVAICFLGMVFIFFSNNVVDNNHIWFGDTAMLVIKTESMETAYKGNTYLKDENGVVNSDDRIPQFSFITISRNEDYIYNIDVNDIVAFKMRAENSDGYITVVHRLIDITYNSQGEPLYTFRGDANVSSMAGEFEITRDKIVGVFETNDFKGVKNLSLGYFVSYMQSSLGITMVSIAMVLILIYSFLYDRLERVYGKRYEELFEDILQKERIDA